jgi:hypothetical protein
MEKTTGARMDILTLLFGARKPKPTPRQQPGAQVFPEIGVNPNAEIIARDEGHAKEWSQLEEKLRQLPIVPSSKAKFLLSELHEGELHSRASSLAAAMYFAAQRTNTNGGDFAEFVRRTEVRSQPVSYLMALHSWKGLFDSFGTKASYFVRVGENAWLCAGQTRYGS